MPGESQTATSGSEEHAMVTKGPWPPLVAGQKLKGPLSRHAPPRPALPHPPQPLKEPAQEYPWIKNACPHKHGNNQFCYVIARIYQCRIENVLNSCLINQSWFLYVSNGCVQQNNGHWLLQWQMCDCTTDIFLIFYQCRSLCIDWVKKFLFYCINLCISC